MNATRETDTDGSGDHAGGLHPLMRKLEKALAQGNIARTERFLGSICGHSALIAASLDDVERILGEHRQIELLEAAILNSLTAVEHPRRILRQLKDFARRHKFLDAFQQALTREQPLDEEAAAAAPLGASTDGPETIAARAEHLVGQTEVDARLVEVLFPHRRQPGMSREVWERGLRFAAALEALTDSRGVDSSEMAALFHRETRDTLRQVTGDNAVALFIIGHVGFTGARNYFIRKFLKNSIPFRPKLDRPPYVWEQDDGRTALFCCLRALSSGTSVVLAADGPMGDTRAPMQILDCNASMATGGAFLAHEAKVNVVWLNIEFRDGYFEATLVKAPLPQPTERLKDYQPRFVSFYETMLNQYFSGDPRSIVIRKKWRSIFLGRDIEEQDDG